MPQAYKALAPRTIQLPEGGDAILIEGKKPVPVNYIDLRSGKSDEEWSPLGATFEGIAGLGSAEERLKEQDADGIGAEILFPNMESGPVLWRTIADDEAYRATVRAYNDWVLQDYASVAPDRLVPMVVLPWTGVADAIAEMERCAKLGAHGIVLGVFPSGKGYPTPEDDAFWAAATSIRMPITIHFGIDRSGPRAFQPVFEYPAASDEVMKKVRREHLAFILTGFGLAPALNMTQLILSGVFDRFPSLRIFFAETRIGWVPFWSETADYWYERHRHWNERLLGFRPVERKPSEYVRDRILMSVHAIENVGMELRHHFAPDALLFATDFPHIECEWPNTRRFADAFFAKVPAADAFRIGAGNMLDFFRLRETKVGQAVLAARPT